MYLDYMKCEYFLIFAYIANLHNFNFYANNLTNFFNQQLLMDIRHEHKINKYVHK